MATEREGVMYLMAHPTHGLLCINEKEWAYLSCQLRKTGKNLIAKWDKGSPHVVWQHSFKKKNAKRMCTWVGTSMRVCVALCTYACKFLSAWQRDSCRRKGWLSSEGTERGRTAGFTSQVTSAPALFWRVCTAGAKHIFKCRSGTDGRMAWKSDASSANRMRSSEK